MTTDVIFTKIEQLMNQRKWSIYKLAKESKIPYSSLNHMLKHKHTPTFKTIIKICDGFNITLSEFFYDKSSSKDDRLLYNWYLIDDTSKDMVLNYIYGLANKQL